MKALAVIPGTKGIQLVERPEPQLQEDDDVKLRVLRVGICGTDREEAGGGRSKAPPGKNGLIIGHEMLGQVVAIGSAVREVAVGDLAVFTVRRGCGHCASCSMERFDMCVTGEYSERGIWGLDGFEAEFVLDKDRFVVRVPRDLESLGVLTEPASVVEKAIDEAVHLQTARLPDALSSPDWLHGRRCLVAGLGPIGLLGGLVLQLRGASVFGLDVVDAGSARPQWLKAIGGTYIDARSVPTDKVGDAIGPIDLILEAAGIATLDFQLLDALAINGLHVLTGIPGEDRPVQISGGELMRRLVLRNQVMVGSVNAARGHFRMAVEDLWNAHLRWPGHVEQLITHRHPSQDAAAAFEAHPADEIKSVVEWSTIVEWKGPGQ